MTVPLRIAFCIRPDYMQRFGGDSRQLLGTKMELARQYDIEIDVVTRADAIGKRYQLCHIFNMQTMDLCQSFLHKCSVLGIKTALSTITWDYRQSVACTYLAKLHWYDINHSIVNMTLQALSLTGKTVGFPPHFSRGYRIAVHQMLKTADIILPNSREEAVALQAISGINRGYLEPKTHVVINGIDSQLYECRALPPRDLGVLPTKFILQVARFEPLKNQYLLIRALMEDRNIPIVMIGSKTYAPAYYAQVENIAQKRGNVFLLDDVGHEMIPHYMRRAALHVLPSIAETTGLVSLEALACGCKSVVTDKKYCPVHTYFERYAATMDPLDIRSIRMTVLSELQAKRDMDRIGAEIRENFNWGKSATQTFQAYQTLFI